MSRTYEIVDKDNNVHIVGQGAIDGGVLLRGFRLKSNEEAERLRAEDPDIIPQLQTEGAQFKSPIPKDVNELAKELANKTSVEEETKPDFEYALSLDESGLDKYAEQFGCKLDGRHSLNTLREQFAKFCDVEWEAPVIKTDGIPEDLKCPHCKATARSKASYINNHGDNCIRNIKPKK